MSGIDVRRKKKGETKMSLLPLIRRATKSSLLAAELLSTHPGFVLCRGSIRLGSFKWN